MAELDSTPAIYDPGDETAYRYRYQSTYAAICSCMLLDDTRDVEQVFCELHEDVLLLHSDGTYSGHQVKTRATDQPIWKTTDGDWQKTITRFIRLEQAYPGRFRSYHFLTNHPLHNAKNSASIRHFLSEIAKVSEANNLANPDLRLFLRLVKNAKCAKEIAFSALLKTKASDLLPHLSDIETRLFESLLSSWEGAEERSAGAVRRAASALADECARASSLAHTYVLPGYLASVQCPGDTELKERIDGKRIDQARLLAVLEKNHDGIASLDGHPDAISEPGIGSSDLLQQKLDAGGFSAVSCSSAEDLRSKADYQGIAWTKKYGREKGLQRYSHARSIVHRDAAKAFEATKTADDSAFGLKMLEEFRQQILRRRNGNTQLFDCSDEHLEGLAYSLTAECKVQWSTSRPWEVQA